MSNCSQLIRVSPIALPITSHLNSHTVPLSQLVESKGEVKGITCLSQQLQTLIAAPHTPTSSVLLQNLFKIEGSGMLALQIENIWAQYSKRIASRMANVDPFFVEALQMRIEITPQKFIAHCDTLRESLEQIIKKEQSSHQHTIEISGLGKVFNTTLNFLERSKESIFHYSQTTSSRTHKETLNKQRNALKNLRETYDQIATTTWETLRQQVLKEIRRIEKQCLLPKENARLLTQQNPNILSDSDKKTLLTLLSTISLACPVNYTQVTETVAQLSPFANAIIKRTPLLQPVEGALRQLSPLINKIIKWVPLQSKEAIEILEHTQFIVREALYQDYPQDECLKILNPIANTLPSLLEIHKRLPDTILWQIAAFVPDHEIVLQTVRVWVDRMSTGPYRWANSRESHAPYFRWLNLIDPYSILPSDKIAPREKNLILRELCQSEPRLNRLPLDVHDLGDACTFQRIVDRITSDSTEKREHRTRAMALTMYLSKKLNLDFANHHKSLFSPEDTNDLLKHPQLFDSISSFPILNSPVMRYLTKLDTLHKKYATRLWLLAIESEIEWIVKYCEKAPPSIDQLLDYINMIQGEDLRLLALARMICAGCLNTRLSEEQVIELAASPDLFANVVTLPTDQDAIDSIIAMIAKMRTSDASCADRLLLKLLDTHARRYHMLPAEYVAAFIDEFAYAPLLDSFYDIYSKIEKAFGKDYQNIIACALEAASKRNEKVVALPIATPASEIMAKLEGPALKRKCLIAQMNLGRSVSLKEIADLGDEAGNVMYLDLQKPPNDTITTTIRDSLARLSNIRGARLCLPQHKIAFSSRWEKCTYLEVNCKSIRFPPNIVARKLPPPPGELAYPIYLLKHLT